MLFAQIKMVITNWQLKPMPVIYIVSATCDSFSNMWNFYCNPCLVIK